MALVKCRECGKEKSSGAEVCPHCGFKQRKTSLFTWLVAIFIGVPVVGGILLGSVSRTPSSQSAAPAQVAAQQSTTGSSPRSGPSIGAAPQGDATSVASRVIKANFATCRRVTKAARGNDGAVRARCDATDYLVFTIADPKSGKTHEVALNCTAARTALGIDC